MLEYFNIFLYTDNVCSLKTLLLCHIKEQKNGGKTQKQSNIDSQYLSTDSGTLNLRTGPSNILGLDGSSLFRPSGGSSLSLVVLACLRKEFFEPLKQI